MGYFLDKQEATRYRYRMIFILCNCVFLTSVQEEERFSSPPGGAGTTTAVKVTAELREVNCRCSGCRTIETKISRCC